MSGLPPVASWTIIDIDKVKAGRCRGVFPQRHFLISELIIWAKDNNQADG